MGYIAIKSNAARVLAATFFSLLFPLIAFAARSSGPGETTIRALLASMKSYAQATTPAERAATAAKVSHSLALRKIARESLGAQWDRLDRADRDHFASLFKRSIEALAYPRASQALSEIKVRYVGETTKGTNRIVSTRVVRPEGGEIPVDYTLARLDGHWAIADVSLDGESLAKAVRNRIQTALQQEGYAKLVADLERRLEQATSREVSLSETQSRAKGLSDRSVRVSPR